MLASHGPWTLPLPTENRFPFPPVGEWVSIRRQWANVMFGTGSKKDPMGHRVLSHGA